MTDNNDSRSQCARILAWLQEGKSINPMEALVMFGSFRLGARISDLRKMGHDIVAHRVTRNGKRFAEYNLREYEN